MVCWIRHLLCRLLLGREPRCQREGRDRPEDEQLSTFAVHSCIPSIELLVKVACSIGPHAGHQRGYCRHEPPRLGSAIIRCRAQGKSTRSPYAPKSARGNLCGPELGVMVDPQFRMGVSPMAHNGEYSRLDLMADRLTVIRALGQIAAAHGYRSCARLPCDRAAECTAPTPSAPDASGVLDVEAVSRPCLRSLR